MEDGSEILIFAILNRLKRDGLIVSFRPKKKKFLFSVRVKGIKKSLTVEFAHANVMSDDGTARFFQVPLPYFEKLISYEEIKKVFQREIERRLTGIRKERIVRRALVQLRQEGIIQNFSHANDYRDMRGVDFVITFFRGEIFFKMPLQVKSSKFGQVDHEGKYPDIPSVVVSGFKGMKSKVKKIISAYAEGKILHL